jgi:hypothetical protein
MLLELSRWGIEQAGSAEWESAGSFIYAPLTGADGLGPVIFDGTTSPRSPNKYIWRIVTNFFIMQHPFYMEFSSPE